MYYPLLVGGSVFIFVSVCITLSPFYFCNHLAEEERAGCFAFVVLRMSWFSKCSVALPGGALGWFAMCDCGIS